MAGFSLCQTSKTTMEYLFVTFSSLKFAVGPANVCLSLLKIVFLSLNVQNQQRNDRCLFSLSLLKIFVS
jgi:hypothetical protein